MLLILTATLGESRFLAQTVASVAALTLSKRHVLVVPADKVAPMRARFGGCEVVSDAGESGGLYGALNAGLCAGSEDWDWFTCIHDDDVLGSDFERMARAHATVGDPRGVAYGNVAVMDELGRPQGLISVETKPSRFAALLHGGVNPLSHPGMIFGRRMLEDCGGFDDRWRVCGDLDFWLKAYNAGYSFVHYAGEAARFRIRRGQLSARARAASEVRMIVRHRLLPRPSMAEIIFSTWCFRWNNAPRRLRRVFSTGWRSNAELLARECAEPLVRAEIFHGQREGDDVV